MPCYFCCGASLWLQRRLIASLSRVGGSMHCTSVKDVIVRHIWAAVTQQDAYCLRSLCFLYLRLAQSFILSWSVRQALRRQNSAKPHRWWEANWQNEPDDP
jgi:hypothetical protein